MVSMSLHTQTHSIASSRPNGHRPSSFKRGRDAVQNPARIEEDETTGKRLDVEKIFLLFSSSSSTFAAQSLRRPFPRVSSFLALSLCSCRGDGERCVPADRQCFLRGFFGGRLCSPACPARPAARLCLRGRDLARGVLARRDPDAHEHFHRDPSRIVRADCALQGVPQSTVRDI